MKRTLILVAVLFTLPALAQQSASYNLSEHTFNAGGHPADGAVLSSPSYLVTLDALGDGVVGRNLASASYRMDASLASAYPPPGEVAGLLFTDPQTLSWSAERSAGVYDLYRDDTSDGYGTCEQRDLPRPPATVSSEPMVGNGFFYLVTVKNRLREEGTKGFRSNETERLGGAGLPVCP